MATLETVFSTSDLSHSERFHGFHRAIRAHFIPIIDIERMGSGDFRSEIRQRFGPGVSFTRISCDPVLVNWRAEYAAPSAKRAYHLRVQIAGQSTVSQFGRYALLQENDFTLIDQNSSYTISNESGPMQSMTIGLDDTLIEHRLGDCRRHCALPIVGGSGAVRIAMNLMTTMAEEVQHLNRFEVEHALSAAIALIAPQFGRHGAGSENAAARGRASFRQTIENYIEANLFDPGLSPRKIAQAHNISVRYIFKLFESEGPKIAALIRLKRLLRCRAALLDPAFDDQTVTDIAFANGFSDSAHFSRAFRNAFEISPKAFRQRRDL